MTGAHPVAFYLKELSGEPARRGGRALALGPEGTSDLETQLSEAHTRGVLEAEVEGGRNITPYARWAAALGLWPLWGAVLAVLAFAMWRARRAKPAA